MSSNNLFHEDLQQQTEEEQPQQLQETNARHGHREKREPFLEREQRERVEEEEEEEEKIFPFCLNLIFEIFEKTVRHILTKMFLEVARFRQCVLVGRRN